MTKQANTYTPFFKAWPTKQVGPRPSDADLTAAHGLGLRPGKQALANAMALRDCGVSGAQIVMVCGAPQLNRMRGLIADGHVKRVAVPANEQGHTVYKLTLTAKGEARIKRADAAADKAAVPGDKPAAKKAARKRPAKVKPEGDTTATAPAQGDAPQGDATDQPQA